jgi:hypothetical protein
MGHLSKRRNLPLTGNEALLIPNFTLFDQTSPERTFGRQVLDANPIEAPNLMNCLD